ncbi:MAG: hypothetical protein HPY53_07575 [Brevinematales bacterium]|nr:hypothetical protein [Brevinematales bacterium]
MNKFIAVLVTILTVSLSWGQDLSRSTNAAELTKDELQVNDFAWRANILMFDSAYLQKQQTLLDDLLIPVGGMGGPSFMFTTVNNEFTMMMGGGGGMLLGHSLILGGAGYGMTSANSVSHISGTTTNTGNLTFGYGGFMLGYIFFPESVAHFTVFGMIGGGGVTITPSMTNGIVIDPNAVQTVFPCGAASIGASFDVNIGKMIRASVSGGYRMIWGVNDYHISGVSDAGLSGPYGAVSLSFGWF